jgi:putative FmdB family regulatory protein
VPTYEYRCPKGHTFEVFQRMADAPIQACEECGASPVEKVLFPVAVHFKGSGFYATDYGKKRKAAGDSDGGSSGESKSGSDSSSSGSSDSSAKSDSGSSPSGDSGPKNSSAD